MRLPSLRWSCSAAAFLIGMAGAVPSRAQGTGRSLDLDPSVRAAGMGLASNAVFWDENTNHWGNPALLGYQRGLSYEWGRTRLVPGLAPDVHFTTNVVKLGGAGLGLALAGKPVGVGGLHLSYGESEGTDENGNPTGVFESFEDIESWSFGLSLGRLSEAVATLMGRDPAAFSRYGDVSFGMSGKHLEMNLGPGLQGETNAHDKGYLVRFSPLELAPGIRDVVGLDLAYGWSKLSYDGDPILFPSEDQPAPISEHERRGYAGRLRVDWPGMAETMAGPSWLWEGLRPLLSVARADDHSSIGVSPYLYKTDGDGWEFTVANVFSWRRGHYEDRTGDIIDDTEGWGVGLPIGNMAGVRYDYASFPQARGSDLPNVKRRAVTGWVDAVRAWRMWRP